MTFSIFPIYPKTKKHRDMKKLTLLAMTIALMLSCNTQDTAKTGAEQLLDRLQALQQKGYMFGHEDDTFYGLTWDGDTMPGVERSDILATVGDYPAVMGFDLGGIEMGDKKNLDSVAFTRIHDEIVKHHARGGIVTISWHPRNPVTEGNAWDVNDTTVVRQILEDDSVKGKFNNWMTRVADFLKTLKTDNGEPVPVIFRPWHENNGSWFWWGQKQCSDEEFRGLWNTLQDFLNNQGLDNLLWSYSPNLDGGWNEQRFLARYPGNNRVQLIGEDAYQWGTEDDFKKALDADLAFLADFAKKNDKLIAMTECGFKNIPDSTWWTRVLKPIMDNYPICYFLPWRNYNGTDKVEYFAPDPDQVSAEDFKKLYQAPNTLFLKDIQ